MFKSNVCFYEGSVCVCTYTTMVPVCALTVRDGVFKNWWCYWK